MNNNEAHESIEGWVMVPAYIGSYVLFWVGFCVAMDALWLVLHLIFAFRIPDLAISWIFIVRLAMFALVFFIPAGILFLATAIKRGVAAEEKILASVVDSIMNYRGIYP